MQPQTNNPQDHTMPPAGTTAVSQAIPAQPMFQPSPSAAIDFSMKPLDARLTTEPNSGSLPSVTEGESLEPAISAAAAPMLTSPVLANVPLAVAGSTAAVPGTAYQPTARIPRARKPFPMEAKISLAVAAFIVVVTGITFFSQHNKSNTAKQSEATVNSTIPEQDLNAQLPVEESTGMSLQGTSDALIVNGDVVSQGAMKLYAGDHFSNIVQGAVTADRTVVLPDASGVICLDVNNCSYASVDTLRAIQDQLTLLQNRVPSVTSATQNLTAGDGIIFIGNVVSNDGVSSLNGQTGAVTLTSGAGISIAGTTVTNNGVIGINGSGNVVITDLGNGQFDINDVGAGAATVTLGPAAPQEDATNNPSINITKTGGAGGLLSLSTGSTPVQRFVVDATGAITTGHIDFSQLTSTPSLVNTIGGLSGTVTLGTGLGVSGQSLLNTGVTSINGQSGALTLTGDVGIVVDNGTISNAGVTKLTGTVNQVSVSSETGNVTISLPQDIAVTSSPTFAAITVGSATVNGDLTITGTSTGTGNQFIVTGSATGSRTITFPDASGTVCVSTNNCNYQAAGSYVNLQLVTPGTAQTGNLNLTGTIIAGTQLTSPLLDSPAGLTLAGQSATSLTLGRAGVAANTPGGLNTNGANITSLGGNLDLNTGTITAGLVNGQQISTTANFTGTLTVAGTTTLTGSVTANTITANAAMTVGSVAQALTLQGTTTAITSTNGAGTHTSTLTFATPTADVTYTLQSAATGSYDICTTSGNCAGVGGGVTTAGGTAGQLAKFTGSQGIGDSIIADDGSTVTIAGALSVNTITPTANATIGSSSYNLALQGAATTISSTNLGITTTVSFATPTTTNKSIVFPDASGTVCLTNGNCAGAGSGLTGSGSANAVARFDASQNLVNSSLTDDGTNATAGGNFTVSGILQANGAIQGNTSLTLGISTQASTLQGSATTVSQTNSTFTNSLVFATASGSNKTLTLPNETGTICTTGSICSGYQAAGTFVNLQASTPGAQQVGNINVSGTVLAGTNLTSNGSISSTTTVTVGTDLTVGTNATVTGTLGVTGATTLTGALTANGTATFRPTTNSTSSFVVQNASGGSLFEVDSTNSVITVNGGAVSAEGTAWTASANTLPAVRMKPSSIVNNGYAYIFGGCSNTNCSPSSGAQATIYYTKLNSDGSAGTWSTNATTMPLALYSHTTVVNGGYVYLIGGYDNTGTAQTNVYYAKINSDGSIGSWSTNATALPQVRAAASSVIVNGYIYVIGGYNASTTRQYTTYYAPINSNASVGTWVSSGNLLPDSRALHASTVVKGYIYVIGGAGPYNTVFYTKANADGSIGTWSTNANTLPEVRDTLTVVTANGYLYAIGGSWGGPKSAVYFAQLNVDGSTGTWSTSTNPLPQTRYGHTSFVYNGYVYAVGGQGSSCASACNTVYYTGLANPSTRIGGTLDLTSLGSDSNLLGNNGSFAGTLQVSGAANFMSSLTVGGSTSANGLYSSGTNTFQSTTNSSTFFQVQNAAGSTAFNVDTVNLRVGIGTNTPTTSLDVRGDVLFKNQTDTATAFQIQKADSTALFNVDTTSNSVRVGGTQIGEITAWVTNANALPAVRQGAYISTTANGFAYVVGGYDGASAQSTVYYAQLNGDGSTGAWTTNINALPAVRYLHSVVAANGYLYVIGGNNGTSAQSTVYYAQLNGDGSTGAWTTSANPLLAVRQNASVVAANGYLYVIGGNNGTSAQSTVYYAQLNGDGSTGAWTTSANPITAARELAGSVVMNGYVYVVGGSNGTSAQTTIYYAQLNADGSTSAWTTSTNPLPTARQSVGLTAANGYIYVIAGYSTSPQSIVYYAQANANGSTGTWSTSAYSLPDVRYNNPAITYGGYVYTLGGCSSSCANTKSTVYYSKLVSPGNSTTAFQVINSSNTTVFNVDTTNQKIALNGVINTATTFKNDTNSTSAFNIQNTAGSNLFTVDTTNSRVSINSTLPGELSPWQTNGNALITAVYYQTSVVANGYTYVIGGYNPGAGGAQTSVYYAKLNADGSTGAWTTNSQALPVGRYYHTSVTANGYLYVIGGAGAGADCTSSICANVYYAKLNTDGSTGAWKTNSQALPSARYTHTSVAANGYVYVIGGYNSSSVVQSTVYYAKLNADGSTGAWTTSAQPLTGARAYHSSVTANGYVYVIAGYNGSSSMSTVYYAQLNSDGSTGAWTTNANALPAIRNGQSSVVANGNLYILSGRDGTGAVTTVYYAKLNSDGSTTAWSTSSQAVPAGRYYHSSVGANGYLYIFGGHDGSAATSTVYYTSVARTQIGGSLDLTSLNGAGGGDLYTGGITASGTTNLQGQVALNPTTDSATLFQINNSLGNNLLNVDSSTATISLLAGQGGGTGTWVTGSNALPSARSSHSSVIANGYIYTIGGTNQSTIYYAKLNADGSTGAWTTNANALPAGRMNHTSVAANGYIYVIGGSAGVTTIYYAKLNADGSTGAWTTNANALPAGRMRHASIAANGYVYVIGGFSGTAAQSTVYYAKLNADGSTGAWTTNANALPNVRDGSTALTANGYVYVIGGSDGTSVQSSIYYAKLNADGSTGAWSTNTNVLPAAYMRHSAVTLNGYIYVIGGFNGTAAQSIVYYAKLNADGSINTWSTNSNALPAARQYHTTVTANGYIYVVAGQNASGTDQSTVYYTSTARILTGGSLDLVGASNGNLAEGGGASGGSIYAGNGDFLGTLSVRDQATFASSVSVDKELAVRGSAFFQNTTNSTSEFAVQNSAGGSLFNVDSTNSNISINSNNSGEIQAWRTGTNILPAVRQYHTSVVANGYVYVIGGYNGATGATTVYYAKLNSDGSTGTWTTNTNTLPVATMYHSSATANGYIYVVAGNGVNTVYYAKLNADGSTGAWSTNTNGLPAIRTAPSVVAANGYLYTIGGYNGTAAQATVYYAKLNADGSTAAWSTNANPLPAGRMYLNTVSANGYIYAIGGSLSGSPTATVYYAKLNADGSTAAWSTNANPLPASRRASSSVVSNGYVYVMGGASTGNGVDTVYYAKLNADGSTAAWSTSNNPLPAGRSGQSSVYANGFIYVIGGSLSGASLDTVYYTSTARILIGGSIDLVGATATGNLADGGLGGNLTANSGEFLGSLSVRDQANFTSSVSVGGEFVARGSTLFQNSTDSLSGFRIQNSSGANLLSVDTDNGVVRIGVIDGYEQTNPWTARAAAAANIWRSVAYGNGLYVAVTDSATNQVMTSTDGITWTARTSAEANSWNSVTYGNGLFVAVAVSGTNRVMTSPDGITWTARAAAEANQWWSVTYGNGLFVAVAVSGTNRVMTSADGITWTARTAAQANQWRAVTYGNNLFVAVADNGTNRVMTSPDGITWTVRTQAASNQWKSVAYGNGLYVAVSVDGTNRVMTSPDGTTWTARNATEANSWFAVTYGSGQYVAVASDGTNRVMTSADGITWRPRPAPEANTWAAVTFGNDLFVAVSGNGTNRVMTSPLTAGLSGAKLLVSNAEITTTLRVGDASNGIDLSATGISFRGTARPTRRIRLAAEYPGAVFDADGSNNTGTMSTAYDNTSGIKMTYYKWTTASGTPQDQDIIIQVPIPQDFSAWAASNPLSISVYNSDTTANNIQIEITDSAHTTAGTMTDITAGTASTWTTQTPAVLVGTYTAGDTFSIRLRLTAPTGGDIRIGDLYLNYLASF